MYERKINCNCSLCFLRKNGIDKWWEELGRSIWKPPGNVSDVGKLKYLKDMSEDGLIKLYGKTINAYDLEIKYLENQL